MIKRILEPEVMDSEAEALEYDLMDFTEVNTAFAEKAIELASDKGTVLDAGTGTARIPILIAQKRPNWRIVAIDLAKSMLSLAEKNIREAGLENQIKLEQVDVKNLPYPNKSFEGVISNSLVHHLPQPLVFFQEIQRVLQAHGAILIRDLIRPESERILDDLVVKIGIDYDRHQQKLFRDSLQAALTLAEVQDLVNSLGLDNAKVYQSSELHWTIERVYG